MKKQNQPCTQQDDVKIETNIFKPKEITFNTDTCSSDIHTYGSATNCDTDKRGHSTPKNRSPEEIVLDATEGFVPLWKQNQVLRWKFNENSMDYFSDPHSGKQGIRKLFQDALTAWGDSSPIRFKENSDTWDFEIYMSSVDRCRNGGCVLASAFFPDGGRHRLVIYPKMLAQNNVEQVETLIHEIGHIFGLRHFFANVSETSYPSVIFGEHKPFSIMNYGHNSKLTETDKNDLKSLYTSAWNGTLSNVNGTPIVLVQPYHYLGMY